MIKKLLLTGMFITGIFTQSQIISLTGSKYNWGNGVDLNPIEAGKYYTLNNVSLDAGEYKFRQDYKWDKSWGSDEFPAGNGNKNDTNIKISTSGIYNITLNITNGAYTFSTNPYPTISLIGEKIGANAWSSDVDLTTTDGINYSLKGYLMKVGEFKFRTEHVWSSSYGQGNNGFPIGNAVFVGNNINATQEGTFDISFNRNTGDYIFTEVTMAVSDIHKKRIVLNSLVQDDLIFSESVKNVDIYSNDGKLLKSVNNVKTIKLSALPKGVYILKIQTNSNEIVSQKIMKN